MTDKRKDRAEAWRKRPITPAQIGKLLALGERNISSRMSRGRASDLIAQIEKDRERWLQRRGGDW